MKYKLLALIGLLPVFTSAQVYRSHTFQKDRLAISLNEGTLEIIPLSDNAIRVKWEKEEIKETRELILTNGISVPAFTCSENNSKLYLKTKSVTVIFDKQDGVVRFSEPSGKLQPFVNGNPPFFNDHIH